MRQRYSDRNAAILSFAASISMAAHAMIASPDIQKGFVTIPLSCMHE
jgi:hypothetical protein